MTPEYVLNKVREPVLDELEEMERELVLMTDSRVPAVGDMTGNACSLRGKRLRPLLLLLSCGLEGRIGPEAVRSAAMIELLHTATLVHDDVVDDSDMRRGGPSVKALWGNKAAVLMGDMLFSRVLQRLSEIGEPEAVAIVSRSINTMCEGELLQLSNGLCGGIDAEAFYIDLVSMKTGSLFAAACELGGLFSGPRYSMRKRIMLHGFGMNLGIAFQIRDDLIDRCSDQDIAFDGFIRELGGIEGAAGRIRYYAEEAVSCLGHFEDSIYRSALTSLAGYICLPLAA